MAQGISANILTFTVRNNKQPDKWRETDFLILPWLEDIEMSQLSHV